MKRTALSILLFASSLSLYASDAVWMCYGTIALSNSKGVIKINELEDTRSIKRIICLLNSVEVSKDNTQTVRAEKTTGLIYCISAVNADYDPAYEVTLAKESPNKPTESLYRANSYLYISYKTGTNKLQTIALYDKGNPTVRKELNKVGYDYIDENYRTFEHHNMEYSDAGIKTKDFKTIGTWVPLNVDENDNKVCDFVMK